MYIYRNALAVTGAQNGGRQYTIALNKTATERQFNIFNKCMCFT